jgi:hypothetical protein
LPDRLEIAGRICRVRRGLKKFANEINAKRAALILARALLTHGTEQNAPGRQNGSRHT